MTSDRRNAWRLAVCLVCFGSAVTMFAFMPPLAIALMVVAVVTAIRGLRGTTIVRGAAMTVLVTLTFMAVVPLLLAIALEHFTSRRTDRVVEILVFVVPQVMLPYHLQYHLPSPLSFVVCGLIWAVVALATGFLGARLKMRSLPLLLLSLGMVAATTLALGVLSIAIGGNLGIEGP